MGDVGGEVGAGGLGGTRGWEKACYGCEMGPIEWMVGCRGAMSCIGYYAEQLAMIADVLARFGR